MTTMLDKCAIAGDITQAIDRRGAWTVAITVIGGTDSTAVKLQSAETANGSFTDFKILIASSEASSEQYKGFVVDLHGAKQFIKVVGATMATAVLGDCDHDVKQIAIKAGEIPSADLEDNKSATINVSTYTVPVEIAPTAGKDGMKKATVTLSNIPDVSTVKFYFWTSNDYQAYTMRATPSVGDKVYRHGYDDGEISSITPKTVKAVEDDTITIDDSGEDVVCTRDSSKDLTFSIN